MEQENLLTFDEKSLFNNEKLQQYDKDGQIGFLGYLIRYENWKITNNKIVFPEIKSEEEIERALADYNASVIKNTLNIKRQALSDVTRFGTYDYERILDRKLEEIEKSEADVVHISPSHNFPTGIVTPIRSSYALLD